MIATIQGLKGSETLVNIPVIYQVRDIVHVLNLVKCSREVKTKIPSHKEITICKIVKRVTWKLSVLEMVHSLNEDCK